MTATIPPGARVDAARNLLFVDVTLLRVADGATRVVVDNVGRVMDRGIVAAMEDVEFHWHDGNYGCDCNRKLLFARAAGEEDPPEELDECGTVAFRIVAPGWLEEEL